MDDNLFFRKASLLILSSLELDVALQRFYQFIQDVIPVDEIYTDIYLPKTQSLHFLAKADQGGGKKMDLMMSLPPELVEDNEEETGKGEFDVLVNNQIEKNSISKFIFEKLGFKSQLKKGNWSSMVMLLSLEKKPIWF